MMITHSAPADHIPSFTPTSSIEKLSFLLIRPPKHSYNPDILLHEGSNRFFYQVQEIPFELSLYIPKVRAKYFVLYLHGNSSSRIEALNLLRYLPEGVGLATFDFEGCGNRQGKWVTLGLKESKEVDTAVRFLKAKGLAVVGWGRSMGAVSLLMSDGCDIMVVDSPFQSLKRVCRDTAKKNKPWWVPNCMLKCVFPCLFSAVKKDIKNKTKENIQKLELMKRLQFHEGKAIMFMTADKDEIIHHRQSRRLFENFNGEKQFQMFSGSHNSVREREVYKRCFRFIEDQICRLISSGDGGVELVRAFTIQTKTMSFQEQFNTPHLY